MVLETSTSTTLPHQSCAAALPNLGAKHNHAHVKRYRSAALPQGHDNSITLLLEMLLQQKRPHLKENCCHVQIARTIEVELQLTGTEP